MYSLVLSTGGNSGLFIVTQSTLLAVDCINFDRGYYLTDDELESVTNILLEALAREEGITPEVFEIETNIYVEAVYFNS